MKKKVLVSGGMRHSPEGMKILQKNGLIPEYRPSGVSREEIIGDYTAFIGGGIWKEEDFARAGNLKILARLGSGYDSIDIDAATRFKVTVTCTPGANAPAVAEHALAMILDLSRNLYRYQRKMRDGKWGSTLTRELAGKTVGIVGLGHIGWELVHKLKGWPVEILAYDIKQDPELAEEHGVSYVGLGELFTASDIVSIHCPLTEKTRGLIDSELLGAMKPGAILVNTSRGEVVDEQALIRVLEEGEIAGAGLDVFFEEPLPEDHKLRSLPNVLLTPHAASITAEAFEAMGREAARAVADYFRGKLPSNTVNPGAFKA